MEMTVFPPLLAVNLVSEHLLLLFSILIFAAVLVTKVGSRYGVPSLLLFLLLGMVAGEDVLGVRFDDFELAENIGHFAMTIILFTAGLETSFKETRPVVRQGALLSTAGVLLTILFSGVFIWLVSDAAIPVSMSLTEALSFPKLSPTRKPPSRKSLMTQNLPEEKAMSVQR